jgi:predicted nucleic acid-binding Zn ribbon protein
MPESSVQAKELTQIVQPSEDASGRAAGVSIGREARRGTVWQHKHCYACGRAILVTQEFCDDDCKMQHVNEVKKKRKRLVMLWAVSMAIIFLVLVMSRAFG